MGLNWLNSDLRSDSDPKKMCGRHEMRIAFEYIENKK